MNGLYEATELVAALARVMSNAIMKSFIILRSGNTTIIIDLDQAFNMVK